jgi:hypothetical protein
MARGSTVRVLTTARSVTLELRTDRIPTALRKETVFGLLDLFMAKVRRSHHYGTILPAATACCPTPQQLLLPLAGA